jgi:hypothetical protein
MKNNNTKFSNLKLVTNQVGDPQKEVPIEPVPSQDEPVTAFKTSDDVIANIGSNNKGNTTTGNYLSL